MTDDERAEWRRIHRARREKMEPKDLMIEALERLDGIASVLSTLGAKTQETAQVAEDARRVSSTVLRAVQGPACEHMAVRYDPDPSRCTCPPSCYCRGVACPR